MLKTIFVAVSAITLAAVSGAHAQSPTKLNQFDAWAAYSYKSGNNTICYVLSVPLTSEPTTVKHGDNFFLVSKRPNAQGGFEPQFMAGYPLKPNSNVTVTVDGKDFDFFTKDSSAWLESTAAEAQLIKAMRAGSNLSVKAVSVRGTNTSYTYSLKGISAALNMAQKCK